MDEYIIKYGPRLFGLCRTLCGNGPDAEDLYQETWLRAYRFLHRYDPGRPFEPWLTKICVNIYRSLLRRLVREPALRDFASNEEKDHLLEQVPAEERQDYTELHRAIDSLPEKLRVTVILYYFEDRDVATAAKILGVPPGTVKSMSVSRGMAGS